MQELDFLDSLNDWLYTSALTSGKTELSNQATRNVFTKDLAMEKKMWGPMGQRKNYAENASSAFRNRKRKTKIICNIEITLTVRMTIQINQAYLRVNEAVSLDN